MSHLEPLLTESAYEPGVNAPEFPSLKKLLNKAQEVIWRPGECDFKNDMVDWEQAFDDRQRRTLTVVFGFFRRAEAKVLENLGTRFYDAIVQNEAKDFIGLRMGCETIHKLTYERIIESAIRDASERRKLLTMVDALPCVVAKNAWAAKWWCNPKENIGRAMLVSACVEGMFFSTSFAVVYYVKKYFPNKLMGATFANNLISRDEALHFTFAKVCLNEVVKNRPPSAEIREMVQTACEIEKDFAREALCHGGFPGLRQESLVTYAEFTADFIMQELGEKPIYGVANPLPYMNMIAMHNLEAFFEGRGGEYQHPVEQSTEGMWDMTAQVVF